MCAGFPAGKRNGHHLVNRSSLPALPRNQQLRSERLRRVPGGRSRLPKGARR
jgi:hypothetical protein